MGRLRQFLSNSGRINLARMSARELPAFSAVLAVWALGNALLPNAVLVAMGSVVTATIARSRAHLAPLGGPVTEQLAIFAALSAAMFCLIPTQRALTAYSRTKLTSLMQRRLIAAVSEPVGIAHLEDAATLDKISLAQGSLMTFNPAEAPVALAAAIGVRLQGTVACVIVGHFRWWLGLALFIFWNAVRRPLMGAVRQRIRTFGGDATIMRRATYFENLATQPTAGKELRIFGLGDWVVDRLRESWEAGNAVAGRQYAAIFNTVWKFCPILLALYVLVCLFMAHVTDQHVAATSTIAVTLTVLPMTSYVGQYTADTGGVDWMISTLPPMAELESELRRTAVSERGSAPVPLDAPRLAISFEGVGFRYPSGGDDVFTQLDLEIAAHKSTAIVGVNGAGKTTLVKLLGRLHDPTSGRITVDGRDLTEFEPASWQHKLAVVFQDFNQYPLTALDNVALGAIDDGRLLGDAARAAADAGALTIVEALPRAWETVVSKEFAGGVDLSGGQWQRLALARALFAARRGAGILVLDEPTAWMDVRAEAEFYDRFLSITEGLTTVVISHRFSTVRLADTIVVLDGGRVVEQGSHRELMATGGSYAAMYEVQAARFNEAASEGETV